jgi:NADPH:quinone reductase-like Zn-dependent oxidoreductase
MLVPKEAAMKAIVFDHVGAPLEVLELRDVPIPTIGDEDVLVELSAASVNPGDFLFVEGAYPPPKLAKLPGQIAGTGGGVGTVVKGGRSTSIAKGTRVAFSWFNAWAEYAVVPERWLFRLPNGYPIELAAQLGNVITAWDMLARSKATAGDTIVLTGGSSAVATMLLQLARRKEIRVVSIVRRLPSDLDLRAWGANHVVELSKISRPIGESIAELTNDKGANAVIDCVGGSLGADLVRSLALGGRAIVYGGYSPDPMSIHVFDLLRKASTLESYAYRYFYGPPPPEDTPFLRDVLAASSTPPLRTRIAALYPLDDWRAAVEATLRDPERGKRLIRMKD